MSHTPPNMYSHTPVPRTIYTDPRTGETMSWPIEKLIKELEKRENDCLANNKRISPESNYPGIPDSSEK